MTNSLLFYLVLTCLYKFSVIPVPEDEHVPKQQQDDPKEKKKKEDDIWADFMKDTGFQSKNVRKTAVPNTSTSTTNNKSSSESQKRKTEASTTKPLHRPAEKVKITQIFEFAGEEVKVEKEVCMY